MLFAYLLGSISSAVIVCNIMGLHDPRKAGSNNPGATNVFRIGGKNAALMTFAGDVLKGILPVLLAHYLDLSTFWISAVVISAFMGHCLPIFFSFQGGKGIATALGAVTTMSWQLGLILMLVWLLMFLLFRISSLSGISTAIVLPGLSWVMLPESFALMTLMSVLILWRHQKNIRGLIAGTESRLDKN